VKREPYAEYIMTMSVPAEIYLERPLLTVPQFAERYSWPSESAMRAYIYRADQLGITDAFIRFGRRVLIDPIKFFELLRQPRITALQNEQPAKRKRAPRGW
jgi:hypothetical protein